MSVEGRRSPGADGLKHSFGRGEESDRPAVAKIGDLASELVKDGPAIGREWVGNFKTGDDRGVKIWVPTFPRMASGAVGDALCQIEVTFPWHELPQGGLSQVREVWNLSTTLDLGLTSKVELRSADPTWKSSSYEYPSEEIRARTEAAEQAMLIGESNSYRLATDEEESEVLQLLQELKESRE